MLSYLFWPNPPAPSYDNPKVIAALAVCGLLVAASFAVKRWRNKQSNAMTRKLTKNWGSAAFWFGVTGLFMAVCRVEGISYLSMRFLWVVWIVGVSVFALLQWKLFRMRHYEVIPQEKAEADPREKYLPKKKKK